MSNPIDDGDDLYAAITLNGVRSPGRVVLSGHERVVGWDVQNAKGQAGATTARTGEPIGKFTATFHLCKDPYDGIDEFDHWERYRGLIEVSYNGAKPIALEVYHPDLAANGFTAVVCSRIGPMLYDGKGGASVSVDFLEYRPPKPRASTKAKRQGVTTVDGRGKVDPNAARKAELDKLLTLARSP